MNPVLHFWFPGQSFPGCQYCCYPGKLWLTSRNRVDRLRQLIHGTVPWRVPEVSRTTLDHNRSYIPDL